MKKFPWIMLIVLIIVIGYLYLANINLQYSLRSYQAIPDVWLTNTLETDARNQDILWGSVSGFVVFDREEDQPKDLRQYYTIKAINKFDDNLNQFFSIEEIVVLYTLAPRSLGTVEVQARRISPTSIMIEDGSGNLFSIDRATKEVKISDANGDVVRLITNDSDYRDFMMVFLKKK